MQQSSTARPKKSGPIRQMSLGPSRPPLVDVSNESRKENDAVIPTVGGLDAQVRLHSPTIVTGSHRAISIVEGKHSSKSTTRLQSSSIQGKRVNYIKVINKKNLKATKRIEPCVPSRPVLSEWVQSISDQLDQLSPTLPMFASIPEDSGQRVEVVGGVHDHVMLGREMDSASLDDRGGKENFTHSL
ncbi:hypothetical protein V6N13_022908 [Hibiscus sabdariffa]